MPTTTVDVVRWWLGTPSWDESFAVLRAKKELLVSQDGLDTVLEQATDDERGVHAAILQAVAGGLSLDFVQAIVVDRGVAREVAHKALLNKDEPVLRVVLAMNTQLGASAEGAALYLASRLAAGETQASISSAQVAAASDPQASLEVAHALLALGSVVPEDLLPAEDVRQVAEALAGR
jgi:hypothetical protein